MLDARDDVRRANSEPLELYELLNAGEDHGRLTSVHELSSDAEAPKRTAASGAQHVQISGSTLCCLALF